MDSRPPTRSAGARWRAWLSALCVVLAAVLVPVSIVGAWGRVQLVDESRFVATLGPLAQDAHVQDLVIDQTQAAIDQRVQYDQLTGSVIDGISGLGLPSPAAAALGLLRLPAADGLRNLVDGSVAKVVRSDAFATIWSSALRDAHRTVTGAATPDDDGIVTLTDAGLGIRLGPVVDQVKQQLTDQGVGIARLIPTIDRTIIVGSGDEVTAVRDAYRVAAVAGAWLPFVTLALFAIGVIAARRRSVAVLWSGVALTFGGLALVAAIAAGSTAVSNAADRLQLSRLALDVVYRTVVDEMEHTAVIVAVLGALVAVAGWVLGDWSSAQRLRGVVGGLNSSARRDLARRGLDTGRPGLWLGRRRATARAALVVLAVVWLLVQRPLSFGDVVLIVVVTLLVAWVLEFLQRRPDELADQAPADAAGEATGR